MRLKLFMFALAAMIFPVSAGALPPPVMISTLNARYSVFAEGQVLREQIEMFDTRFCTAADEVYGRFNVRAPQTFNVAICYGAWIFKSVTGLDAAVAGVYLPERDMFVFQRPEAMASKRILSAVLRHEMLHSVCARAREKNGVSSGKARAVMWLEESLCTALYPAGEYSWSRGKELIAGKDERAVRVIIENGLSSKNPNARRDAYSAAYVYGMERIKAEGELSLFARITE